ncbi:M18 family aminopeptidase [Blautia sp. HCN-1074]|jgi:aspartyl aminopeptidase|uniref:M18 family aminopeptidase n=1 Tax=Blautia sp. HCN-1074 TaxID=3134667 RepID=UPI000E44550D|nr:M18 family aminopeptidase [uncultured Blautia sp.]RGI64548.1 M18 family aminopeptidase [Ruminococcus sp. TM10-9AT]RGW22621.1 M18 family aminopeptidase [Ruminococcus sp. AF13-37]RGW24377.1 M18 family aminopeptidase [Ruminococcus sp. AF13-28]RHD94829.1 M18 family aminopeptidase [Ruminococcus sp. AM30-15AC]RHG55769.1 M18 family aminopeptidase [Ruminococcus sp. AM22-13]RHP58611.1 M18 family aminopeptidase [Ruminococcus sp. AF31-16BH]RHQ65028.1 M18 family aminopeptidase [Ruminococcus sp. AF24-
MYKKTAKKLLKFIQKSPTAFQAVEEMSQRLQKEGFKELKEEKHWDLKAGGNYFVTRNHSAVIAFSIPKKPAWKFHIMASHSDSPALKIKENPEMEVEKAYIKLNVERYGGMLLAPWFDRPLSVAGRLIVRKNGEIQEKLVAVDKDLLVIPNLAIHMNREVNDGYKYNVQKDMLPLYSDYDGKGSFMKLMAAEADVAEEDILGHDLFLYDRTPGTVWGANEEFISAPRLDDIQCAFASLEGFLRGERKESIAVHCVLDNEEVGSTTKQGAASTFLKDTLMRINMGLGRTQEEYLMTLADSFMVSADNAHALHPNHTDKTDPVNRPVLNGGIVIKYNANQKYCTDGVSAAIFKDICDRAEVPYQTFVNRSDMAGGSTLGNISNTQVPMKTVDIGLAQLAMHSVYETTGAKDTESLAKAAAVLFA